MRKILALIGLLSLLAAPARADWTGKDATGATVTFKNPGACTSVVCVPVAQLYDGTNVVTLTTAGADDVSNTLTGLPTYSRMLVFDGTTWDRWTGAVTVSGVSTAANQTTANGFLSTIATNSAGANPVNVNGAVTAQTGLTPGVSQTGTIVAANVDISSIKGTATDVNSGNLSAGTQRNVLATNSPALPAWGHGATGAAVPAGATFMGINSGGNLTGWNGAVTQSGTWTVQPGNTANTTPWLTTPAAGTTGGATPYNLIAAATNNSTNVKSSAGVVYSIQTGNLNASTPYWLKLYDKATAPTCGTDTPVATYLIPPSNSGNNVNSTVGKAFALGIGFCIVTGIDASNNTAIPASTVSLNIDYK